MRRLSAACAPLLLLTACTSADEPVRRNAVATMLNISDPRAANQLTSGFYGIEGNGRWTGRAFSVTLKPPPAASRDGAILLLRFGIPVSSIARLHSIKVSASVNGAPLQPAEFTAAGAFDYERDVPPSALRGGNATVAFTLDKALPPSANEQRELGVVVNTVGFEAK